MTFKFWAGLLLASTLAACGGGSADVGDNASSEAARATAEAAVRTVKQEALTAATTRSSFLTQLNAQGARGYRYLGGQVFLGDGGKINAIYVKDANATYRYAMAPAQTSVNKFLAQANAQGAKGYRFAGLDGRSVIYRKVDGSGATYRYRMLTGQATAAKFLAQANAEGAKGSYYVGPLMFGTKPVELYQKDSKSAATYKYQVLSAASTDAGVLAQLNRQGTAGYRLKTPVYFGGSNRMLYERDTQQSSTFSYVALNPAATSAAFVAQANAQGAKGRGPIGALVQPSATIKSFYFKPDSCTGDLCDSRSPFGF